MSMEQSDPTILVIFGALGDLTWRKLVPALDDNFRNGHLAKDVINISFARQPYAL